MMNIEQIKTQYFDPQAIRLPDYQVGRVTSGNGRSYIRIKNGELENPFRLYTSLTTAINTCAPMAPGLLDWYMRLGKKEADRQLTLSQHYGTLMHIIFGKFLVEKKVNLDDIENIVRIYTSENAFWQPECDEWAETLKYDTLAFVQFCNEHQVKPLGIEYVLLSEKYGFGTLVDLVCKMTVPVKGDWGEVYKSGPNAGKPKETVEQVVKTAIINFKSGRKGFYPNHGIQLIAEKLLWEENFPEFPIDVCMNWAPKEWIGATPTFSLKDWDTEFSVSEVEAIMTLAKIRFADKALHKKFTSIAGFAYMGKPVDECISRIGVQEYCQQKYTPIPA